MVDYIPYYNRGEIFWTLHTILNSPCIAGNIVAYHQPAPRREYTIRRHEEAGLGRLDGTGANINCSHVGDTY